MAVTVVDGAVVGWLAGLVGPGLVAPLGGLARIGAWWVLDTLLYGLLVGWWSCGAGGTCWCGGWSPSS